MTTTEEILIRRAGELLDKYETLIEKLDLTKEETVEEIKKELLEFNIEEVTLNLKKELEEVAGSVDIVKIAEELDNKFETLSKSLEDKAKEFDGSEVLEKFKTDSEKILETLTKHTDLVGFHHTIPSLVASDKIQKFKIFGDKDSLYSLETNGLFSFSKIEGIESGQEISMRTPIVDDDVDSMNFELKITEDDGIETRTKVVNLEVLHQYPAGQVTFETPGTHTFIVPSGVTSICAVAVGAGGGGKHNFPGQGGNGGALAYANNIPVTAGESITITVGGGGSQRTKGGDSRVGNFFYAQGGYHGNNSTRAKPMSGTVTANGGQGGLGTNYIAGGGAGGYSGTGGDGAYSGKGQDGSGGAGGGGSGYSSSTYGGAGGGGVGLKGIGDSGAGGQDNNGNSFYSDSRYTGKGGSGGEDGYPNSNGTNHGCGGKFGGGGAGGGTSVANYSTFCHGGDGGVRIIWGTGRSFPNNAQDVSKDYIYGYYY